MTTEDEDEDEASLESKKINSPFVVAVMEGERGLIMREEGWKWRT